jgi:hypothetical protein
MLLEKFKALEIINIGRYADRYYQGPLIGRLKKRKSVADALSKGATLVTGGKPSVEAKLSMSQPYCPMNSQMLLPMKKPLAQ